MTTGIRKTDGSRYGARHAWASVGEGPSVPRLADSGDHPGQSFSREKRDSQREKSKAMEQGVWGRQFGSPVVAGLTRCMISLDKESVPAAPIKGLERYLESSRPFIGAAGTDLRNFKGLILPHGSTGILIRYS